MPDEGIDIRVRIRDQRQFRAATTSTAGDIEKIGKASSKSNDQIRRSSKLGSGALRGLAKAAIGVGIGLLSIGAAKSAIDTTLGLAKTTVALHRNLGLTNEVASEWAASATARGVDTNALSLSFTNLSKAVVAAQGATKREIATSRSRSLAAAQDLKTIQARITHFRAQQILQLAAVHGDRAETAAVRARGVIQLAALKREEALAKARAKTGAVTLKALAGNKQAMASFRALGITQADLHRGSHDFNFILGKVADGLGRLPGGAKRAAIAQKLLGRSSQTTLPIFTQGRKSMNENLKLANKYGVTLGGKPLKSLRQLQHAQKEMEFAQLGWQVTFATKVAPALTTLIRLVSRGSQWLTKHNNVLKIVIGTALVLGAAFGAASIASSILGSSLVVATAETLGFNLALYANPIVLVIAAIVALGAALVLAYMKFKIVRTIVGDVWSALKFGFNWAKDNWPLLLAILTGPFGLAWLYIIRHWKGILDFFTGLPGKLGKAGKGMWDWMVSGFKVVMHWIAVAWNNTVGALTFHVPGWVPGLGGKGWSFPKMNDPLGGGQGAAGPGATGPAGSQGPTGTGGARKGAGGATGAFKANDVTPLPAAADGGPSFEHTTVLQVDGREIARASHRYDLGQLARA